MWCRVQGTNLAPTESVVNFYGGSLMKSQSMHGVTSKVLYACACNCLAAALACFMVLGSANAIAQETHSGHAASASSGATGQGAHQSEMQSLMQKMHTDMNQPMKGNADVDFATMMIPHHQGAIDMAKIQLKYGKDEKLRKMAQQIIEAQEKEIAELRERIADLQKADGGGSTSSAAAGGSSPEKKSEKKD